MKKMCILLLLPALLCAGCGGDLYEGSRPAYRITFDTGVSQVTAGTPPAIDTTITLFEGDTLDVLPEPAWTGYQFRGWYDAPEDGAKVEPPFTATESVTLYAYWGTGGTPDADCHITFTATEGGLFSNGEATLVKYIRRPPWTVLNMPIAKRADKIFGGWVFADESELTPITVVTSLSDTAPASVWLESGSQFTVVFETYGGRWADNTQNPISVTVAANTEGVITVGDKAPAQPTLAGFLSTGWFTQIGSSTIPFTPDMFINKNLTVFPVWDMGPDFTAPASVTFAVNEAGTAITGIDSNGVTYSTTLAGEVSFAPVNDRNVATFVTNDASWVNMHRMAGKYMPGTEWSMEMYLYMTSKMTNKQFVRFYGEAGSGQAGSLWIEDSSGSSDSHFLLRAFPRGSEQLHTGANFSETGTWFHVAFVKIGSVITVYKNGVRVEAADFGSIFTNAAFNSITTCQFGRVPNIKLYQFTLRSAAPALDGTDFANKAAIAATLAALNGQ
jgi:hypothetical protein